MRRRIIGLALICFYAGQIALHAQEVKLWGRTLQFHGFVSQGFVHTSGNNWLTMNSSNVGSGEFTDFGANASVQITDKLRMGAQLYDRRLGDLGAWHPSLDWAFADYRLKPWIGLRGGKVKTVMGLYNDTQDLDFLYPFALLPQSIYPTDLRECTIAHTGGDVYGTILLGRRLGTLTYTAYAGHRQDSQYGGYPYVLRQPPGLINFSSYGGLQYGGDLRWTTPLKGLLVGVSRMDEDADGHGTTTHFGPVMPYHEWSKSDWANQYYGQYTFGKLHIDSEYRRSWRDQEIYNGMLSTQTDARGWYVAGAYRVAKRLQLGSYYSRYSMDAHLLQTAVIGAESGHIYDKVVTGRIDLNRFLNVKVEGHFMDGYGTPDIYPSGFYTVNNLQGLKQNTNALVAKTSFNF